jgi:serine/threonine protein kinase
MRAPMGAQETIADMIGRQVGRYRVVRHLASGGMAELFIARQEAMGGFEKEIVVKILQRRYAENPRVVQMFLDEARLAAKLNHQSIVHVYDVAEDGGLKYIAMEYIRGETLTDIVRRGLSVQRYLPLEHAVHVVRQTAAGLAYAHAGRDPEGQLLRIVHRDVSPTNILVTMEGQTKIVDFGIARAQDEMRDEAGVRPGKASYMSPEQVGGQGLDSRSDIFSLGIILYELALGQRLFRGPAEIVMKRIVEEKVAPPTAIKRDFPPALELIVMRALEKRPEDRYQTAEEMRVDLEEFLADEGLRTGSRRMAQYMKEIFPPADSPAPKAAVASPAPSESGGVPLDVRVRDDSEELNFDRRAPMSLRFEAAPTEEEHAGSRYAAPIPKDEGVSGPVLVTVPSAALRPKRNGVKTHGGHEPAAEDPPPVRKAVDELPPPPRRAAPASPEPVPPRAAAPASDAVAADRAEPHETPAKTSRAWMFWLVLILGAAALAFAALK